MTDLQWLKKYAKWAKMSERARVRATENATPYRKNESKIEKTGHNKFQGYFYFELSDFLVPALKIFDGLKLSAVVSFGVELASMTLTDLEDGSQFVITSPMSTASLKACHEVQNLGAVQTYIRRYLWVAALEIVEHDAIDSGPGKEPAQKQPGQQSGQQHGKETAAQFLTRMKNLVKSNPRKCAEELAAKGQDKVDLIWQKFTPEEQELISKNW